MIQAKYYASEAELEASLRSNLPLFNRYMDLHGQWKERFINFMTGKSTLPLTYDPFFKCIFNPDTHPERLEQMLSAIIGENVKIQDILPSENVVLSGDSLLIMDILVRLSCGALANIEIQKIPYQFPAERMSCYSSDLLLRQYSRLKSQGGFNYSDMRKVYTIILFEKSTAMFHDSTLNGAYFHHGKTIFNTGLPLELLQEYFIISLDVFRQNGYAKDSNELTIWLSLLATETISDAEYLIRRYPRLEEIYIEMSDYMHRPEEVLSMFSEALRILDRNTVRYMMDELQKEVSDSQNVLCELKSELSSTQSELSITQSELSSTQTQLLESESRNVCNIIELVKKYHGTKNAAISELMSHCNKTESEATQLVDKYW